MFNTLIITNFLERLMMRNRRFGVVLLGLALFVVAIKLAFAVPTPVANSKHNLSASSGNTVRATTEQQVCVFCHTPHLASASLSDPPLWNRTNTTATYTLYSSTYLGVTGLNYPAATQPAQSSKICLSCHDGTIALGSVRNIGGPGGPGTIAMASGLTAATNLGTNLSDDHPVGYLYDQVKDTQLTTKAAGAWTGAIKLEPNDTATGRVQCPTCHNPHDNQYTKFLRTSNTAGAEICTTCHNKTNYLGSGHQASTQAYKPNSYDPVTTVGGYSCVNCHAPHGGLSPPLLRYNEQDTCYNEGCHGNNNIIAGNVTQRSGANWLDIEADMIKVNAHPTNTISGLHTDVVGDELPAALSGPGNRHAECYDCHNPHQAMPAVQKSTRGALRISAALKGTWGVQPTWNAPPTGAAIVNNKVVFATAPSIFTKVSTALGTLTDEYQLCMKCHSNYVTLPVTVPATRNISAEINPSDSSYHGIVPFLNDGVTRPVTNFYVNQTTMVQPWAGNTDVNTTAASEACRVTPTGANCVTFTASRGRVWCSDCHGSELSTMPPSGVTKTAPYGPHGSSLNAAGPGTSNSDKMLVRTIATGAGDGTPLCLGCHKPASYTTGNTGSRQTRHGADTANGRAPEGCFSCHMWENPVTVTGGTGDIFPHGMNKRWVTIGVSASPGSLQMVDSFNGGWYQNINYTAKQCWVDGSGPCNGESGSGW